MHYESGKIHHVLKHDPFKSYVVAIFATSGFKVDLIPFCL
jgi:hypothetical protein